MFSFLKKYFSKQLCHHLIVPTKSFQNENLLTLLNDEKCQSCNNVVFRVCTIDNEYHSSKLQAHLLLPFHNPNKSAPPLSNKKLRD